MHTADMVGLLRRMVCSGLDTCRQLELLRQSVTLQTQARLREARARLGDDTSTAVSAGGDHFVVSSSCKGDPNMS
jgi:hypothetical protein